MQTSISCGRVGRQHSRRSEPRSKPSTAREEDGRAPARHSFRSWQHASQSSDAMRSHDHADTGPQASGGLLSTPLCAVRNAFRMPCAARAEVRIRMRDPMIGAPSQVVSAYMPPTRVAWPLFGAAFAPDSAYFDQDGAQEEEQALGRLGKGFRGARRQWRPEGAGGGCQTRCVALLWGWTWRCLEQSLLHEDRLEN